jgi:predicted helicase
MKLSKDKTSLIYDKFLSLSGIPPETYEYRLGNRSALEWVIDQYQVSTDKRSGITNDPNRENEPHRVQTGRCAASHFGKCLKVFSH